MARARQSLHWTPEPPIHYPFAPESQPGQSMFEYPIQIAQPDIEPYRKGNGGAEFVWTLRSGKSGPHVWINALMHGDEICGAIALDHLLRRDARPRVGTLSLSFCNFAAYRNTNAENPLGTRYVDEDMNRVWDKLDGERRSLEIDRARQLRPLADTADYLIDLHAMTHPTEALVIVGRVDDRAKTAQGIVLAQRIGAPTLMVADRGHAAGGRLRDYGGFGDPSSHRTALVVECGGWWEERSARFALEVVGRALAVFDMADPDDLELPTTRAEPPFRIVESTETVTIRSADFRFVQPFKGNEIIAKAGTVIAIDGGAEVRTPFDDCFLMFPLYKPQPGATAVRFGRISELA